MINTEDVSSIAELSKGNIAENAKNYLKGKGEDFIEAKKQSFEKLKNEIKDLGKQLEQSVKDYEERLKSFGDISTESAITLGVTAAASTATAIRNNNTDDINQQEENQLKKDFESEKKAIQDNIQSKQTTLENKIKGYLPQELQDVESTYKSTQDTIEARRNDVRNGNRIKISTSSVIIVIGVIADYLLGTVSIGNKKIENLVRISNRIVSKLIDDLNYQESRLLPIEGLLDSGLNNLTSSQILNLSPQLGYLQGYDYKGFKFFIKEENNPKFVVKGNKRKYATAVNKDGNDILKSTSSFTLSPDVLIEELKLQIDQKGLVA